jgi:hypothetical protein
MQTQSTSAQWKIDARDVAKAAIMAALTPALLIVQQSLDAGQITFNFKHIGMAAVAGFVGYLIKNFCTPAQTIVVDTPLPTGQAGPNTPAK